MSYSSAFFCALATSVVFGDRSKLFHFQQLLVPLSYLVVPVWSQPILVKRVYTLADQHMKDSERKSESYDGTLSLGEIVTQNNARSFVIVEDSSNSLSSTELQADHTPINTLVTTSVRVGEYAQPSSPSTSVDLDGGMDASTISVSATGYENDVTTCPPDKFMDDTQGSSIGSRALQPLAISAMSLNVIFICALVAVTIIVCKKKAKNICLGAVKSGPGDGFRCTNTRLEHKSLLRLQIRGMGNDAEKLSAQRSGSIMSCIEEELGSATPSSASPSSAHCASSLFRFSAPSSSPGAATSPTDNLPSFHPLGAPKQKRSISSIKSLSLKSSRGSLST